MRRILLAVLFASVAACAARLPEGNWNPPVWEALQRVVDRHAGDADAYAVFDFDLTCAYCDLEHVALNAMIDDDAFAFGPDDWTRIFTADVPDPDKPLGPAYPQATLRNLARDCADLHRELRALRREKGADAARRSDAHAALVSKAHFLRTNAGEAWGPAFGYPWIKRFFTGRTPAEFRSWLSGVLLRHVADGGFGRVGVRTPAARAGRSGVVETKYLRGFVVPQEMKDLIATLQGSGIAVYVVSGSCRDAVLAATRAGTGYEIPAEHIFGVRLQSDEKGGLLGRAEPGAPLTWGPGKPVVVRDLIAPRHGGKDPVLVAGDSNGDYAMLTAFTNLEAGLVFDTAPKADSPLGRLVSDIRAGRASARYLLQGRDETRPAFVRSDRSVRAVDAPREIRAVEEAAARNARLTDAERQALKDRALRALAEFELMPPRIQTKVPERYRKRNLDYAMNCGAAVTPGGRVWATWVAGEDGLKAHVVGAWSDDGGRTWSETKFVVDSHFKDDRFGFAKVVCNNLIANVWCLDDGKLRLTVFQSMNNWIGRGGTWEFGCANPDAAEPVWSEPRYLFPGSVHNKPLKAMDGMWFYFNDYEPMGREYFPELERFMGCGVYATRTGDVLERRGFTRPEGTWHWAEHAAVQRADGSLWMLLRTGKGLMESFSSDAGESWTKPVPTMRMRTCVARFAFRRLASGSLLFVKNGERVDVAPARREKLCAYLSDDDGATWKGPLMLDERNGVSYPDAFQFPDGSVGLTYDHGRGTAAEILFARFAEADVRAGRLVTPASCLKQVVTSHAGAR